MSEQARKHRELSRVQQAVAAEHATMLHDLNLLQQKTMETASRLSSPATFGTPAQQEMAAHSIERTRVEITRLQSQAQDWQRTFERATVIAQRETSTAETLERAAQAIALYDASTTTLARTMVDGVEAEHGFHTSFTRHTSKSHALAAVAETSQTMRDIASRLEPLLGASSQVGAGAGGQATMEQQVAAVLTHLLEPKRSDAFLQAKLVEAAAAEAAFAKEAHTLVRASTGKVCHHNTASEPSYIEAAIEAAQVAASRTAAAAKAAEAKTAAVDAAEAVASAAEASAERAAEAKAAATAGVDYLQKEANEAEESARGTNTNDDASPCASPSMIRRSHLRRLSAENLLSDASKGALSKLGLRLGLRLHESKHGGVAVAPVAFLSLTPKQAEALGPRGAADVIADAGMKHSEERAPATRVAAPRAPAQPHRAAAPSAPWERGRLRQTLEINAANEDSQVHARRRRSSRDEQTKLWEGGAI